VSSGGARYVLAALATPPCPASSQPVAVDLIVDSLCAALIHQKGGSLAARLGDRLLIQEEVLAIEDECVHANILLRLVWRPRELNQQADDESKIVDRYNYSLSWAQFHRLNQMWGPFELDCFSLASNARCRHFHSRWACPGAEAVDTFRSSWSNRRCWWHPPTPLIPLTLHKARVDRAYGVLIVPFRTDAPWWPLLYPADAQSPVRGKHWFSPFLFDAHEPNTYVDNEGCLRWRSTAVFLDFRD